MNSKSYRKTAGILFLVCALFLLLFRENTALTARASQGTELTDGEYAIELTLTGGSGKAAVETPTLLTIIDGAAWANITWSSSNYDYMLVDGTKYLNQSPQGAHSSFLIPVSALDEDLTVIADTLAMGTPHEVEYILHFYSDTIDSKSSLPKEGAKRVLLMAAFIIVGGGILNHFVNEKRKRDYTG